MLRRALVLAAGLALAACGGDSTSPSEPFPDVGGSYAVDGGFDGFTRTEATFTGSLTLTQASRTSGTLGGTMTLTANISGHVTTESDMPILASVTPTGMISFQLDTTSASTNWTFSGTRTGKVITGRHTLVAPPFGTFSGDWTGTSP